MPLLSQFMSNSPISNNERGGPIHPRKLAEKKYHELWYVQVTEKTPTTSFLYFLKTHPVEQIKAQVQVTRFDWPMNSFALEWETLTGNEHTRPLQEEPLRKLLEIHDILQPITRLLFPQWIMDRFKEAMDQCVRGEWMPSISLCGDIVEFIVNEFWLAYSEKLPNNMRRAPPKRVTRGLKHLFDSEALNKDDYERLLYVRRKRDNHVHNYPRSLFMKGDYPKLLKAENLESLKKLSEFFAQENMEANYKQYLDYAVKQFYL